MGLGGCFTVLGLFVVLMSLKSQTGTFQKMGQVIGFSHGPQGTKVKPDVYRTVVRFQGIDGEDSYLVDSGGGDKPAHVMGEFIPLLLSRTNKKEVYFQSPGDQKWGRILLLTGLSLVLYVTIRYGFSYKILSISVVLGSVFVERLHAFSQSGEFDWRKWINGGRNLSSLVPAEVFPISDSKFISWIQITDQAAVSAYQYYKAPPRRSTWGRTLALGTAMIFLSLAWMRFQKTDSFLKKAQRSTGVVIKLENTSGAKSSRSLFAPVIHFYGPAKTRYQFTHDISANPPRYKLGEHVKVLYDPQNPKQSVVDLGTWNYLVEMVLAIFGLLFLWVAARAESLSRRLGERKAPPISIRHAG